MMSSRLQRTSQHQEHRNKKTHKNDDDIMVYADLYTGPTESESYEDLEDSKSIGSENSEGIDLPIPSGYLSPSSKTKNKILSPLGKAGRSASSTSLPMKMAGINDEDRLLMLAKHPNATEHQVVQTLVRQQQAKATREQQQQQQVQGKEQRQQLRLQQIQNHQHQVTFSPAFPVDADTGEAWDRQPSGTRPSRRGCGSSTNTSMTSRASSSASAAAAGDTSFDRAWASNDDAATEEGVPVKHKSSLLRFWRRVLPNPFVGKPEERDDSVVSKQDASLSISMASDKTPKISNIDEKARAKRIRQQLGYLTWGDRWEHFRHKVFGTRQGLIVLALLLILIAAIVVTVITALASQSNDKTVNANQSGNPTPQLPGGTLIPRFDGDGDDVMTDVPTLSPSGQSGQSETAALASTSSPTRRPTTVSPTVMPTSQPTRRQTTLAPVLPDPTRSPTTRLPTPSPTETPTLRPTAAPTARLITVAPTKAPVSPTQPPSSFLDSPPLTALGVALSGSQPDQRFGQAISLSSDGKVIAVGAPSAAIGLLNIRNQAGMVQVFEWTDDSGGFWRPRGFPLVGRNEGDQFGSAVALSADGSILVVSEPMYDGPAGDRSGNVRAFVYTVNANAPGGGEYRNLGQEMYGSAASDHFGLSLSISADGRRLAVGAPYHDNGGANRNVSGQVMVFDYLPTANPGGTWTPIATMAGIDHLDWFGWKVDLADDGKFLCVGAPRNLAFGGYVQCHDLTTNRAMGDAIRNRVEPLRYDDNFGHSIKVKKANDSSIWVAIGAPGKNNRALDSGMAIVYKYDAAGDEWSILGQPIFADTPRAQDELGFAIDLYDDILVLGSPGRATVDRYVLQGDDASSALWERHPAPLTGGADSSFGYAVNQRGDRLAVGSAETGGENTGMVNVYQQ